MTKTQQFETQTKALIDDLKSVCANYGLGNDGNEFKIITQVFLYKFLNDKFVHEIKRLDENIANAEKGGRYVRTRGMPLGFLLTDMIQFILSSIRYNSVENAITGNNTWVLEPYEYSSYK